MIEALSLLSFNRQTSFLACVYLSFNQNAPDAADVTRYFAIWVMHVAVVASFLHVCQLHHLFVKAASNNNIVDARLAIVH